MATNTKAQTEEVEAPNDEGKSATDIATEEFLERVQNPVGEETKRERYERMQKESKQFLKNLAQAAKDEDKAALNKVDKDVIQPAFETIVKAVAEFTGLTVRRLSLSYQQPKGEEPKWKISHTINKARGEKVEEKDEKKG